MNLNLVADENVDGRIMQGLRSAGFKVISVMEDIKGATDKEVIDFAKGYESILLTQDKDFGEYVFAHKIKGLSVILLRYKPEEIFSIIESLKKVLSSLKDRISGKFIVLSCRKIRIREI